MKREALRVPLKLALYGFSKSGKNASFNLKKMPMDISEKNTIQFVQRITFRVSNPVKVYIVSFLSMRTVPFQNDRNIVLVVVIKKKI